MVFLLFCMLYLFNILTFTRRCDIPVVFYKLNTKYITISQNTTKKFVVF